MTERQSKKGRHRKGGSPQKAPSKKRSKKRSPENASPKNASPKNASPKNASPKNASPKNASPKKPSPQKMSPKKPSPKKPSPENASPKKRSSEKRASEKRSSEKRSSEKRSFEKRSPEKRSFERRSENASPENTSSRHSSRGQSFEASPERSPRSGHDDFPEPSKPRPKRALDQLGGAVRTGGDADAAATLSEAWERATREDADSFTHGFHAWPARMHPAIARHIIERFRPKNLVDPFCGGGTTLVEARVAGVPALGVDLSPLAIRVADVRLDARPPREREAFVRIAESVAAASEARVRGRVPIRVDLPRHELAWYGPHVLKELGGLREEIGTVSRFEDRRALAMVFSSILIKVSKQRSETKEAVEERRIRKGLATELFLRKARELAERWQSLAEARPGPRPELVEGDARDLRRSAGRTRFDLVLSSPPYGGTYDYASHHTRHMAWLRLDDSALHRHEIGSRRRLDSRGAMSEWDREVDEMLGAMKSVLAPGGRIVLVMGDAVVDRRRVDVPPQLERLAPRHGLRLSAFASQPRNDWGHGKGPREEHIVLLHQER